MPQVLTTTATILCPHTGKGTTTPATPYVDAQGGYVLCEGDVGVLSCPFTPPCVGYTLKSMGLNATEIAGRKIILATDFQQSVTGLPLNIVETTMVYDDSTPAPLPAGATSAPLAPELLDLAPPVVVAVPPTVPFVTSTMMPAAASIVFTLTSAFPLSWSLVLINGAQGTSTDVTNGGPPGLVVGPMGGSWSTPTLVVTAAMTAAFFSALGPGTHRLYMTGVSKRGKSAYKDAIIQVS